MFRNHPTAANLSSYCTASTDTLQGAPKHGCNHNPAAKGNGRDDNLSVLLKCIEQNQTILHTGLSALVILLHPIKQQRRNSNIFVGFLTAEFVIIFPHSVKVLGRCMRTSHSCLWWVIPEYDCPLREVFDWYQGEKAPDGRICCLTSVPTVPLQQCRPYLQRPRNSFMNIKKLQGSSPLGAGDKFQDNWVKIQFKQLHMVLEPGLKDLSVPGDESIDY